MQEYIQLKKDNILRIGIKDSKGNPTGNYLEFDLEDIELPIKINQCAKEHTNNLNFIHSQVAIIKKRKDKPTKGIFSANELSEIQVLKEFYKREENALDLFLGEGGTKKLLNGRNPYVSMYDDISDMLEPIMPLLKKTSDDIIAKVKEKYSTKKENNVLE